MPTELVRAGDECSLMATPAFHARPCVRVLAQREFEPERAKSFVRLSRYFTGRICASCSRAQLAVAAAHSFAAWHYPASLQN